MKIETFECPKSIRNYEKKNTWNVRRLVDESFVPSAQRTSILYCRLSDFMLNYISILCSSFLLKRNVGFNDCVHVRKNHVVIMM